MITPRNIEWIVGFLEGEGAFGNSGHNKSSACVSAAQVQMEPLERLMGFVGGNLSVHVSKKPNHQPQGRWQLNGIQGAGLMMTIYPLMSPRRKEQIVKALTRWRAALPQTGYRTHCPSGHPLSGDNLEMRKRGSKEGRRCIRCRRAHYRKMYLNQSEGKVKQRYPATLSRIYG